MHGSAPSPSQLGCGNPKQLSTQLPATQTRSGPWLTLLACLIVHACLERPLRDRSHGPPATLLIAAATGLSPALIWGANRTNGILRRKLDATPGYVVIVLCARSHAQPR